MALEEFVLPDLGEGLTESEVVRWHVVEGERVVLDQVIAEVETAKAVVEVPSPWAGVVQRLHVAAGTVVEVGTAIVSFRVDDAPAGDVADGAPAGDVADDEDDVAPPNLVGYGAAAEAATPTRRARRFTPSAEATPAPPGVAPAAHHATAPDPAAPRARSTPPVRALARRLGVVVDDVAGTGERGLVTREDVETAARPAPGAPDGAATTDAADEERVPVRGVRKATAQAVSAAASTVPHVTLFLTVDATATAELLERLRAGRDGQRPTFLAAVVRALCLALARHPEVNARWAGSEIVRRRAVHVGVAAATPRGLLVPVLRDAGPAGLLDLAAGIADLAATARAGRTTPQAMSGGTITVSNVGVFGVDAGTPLLHDGQAAILAVGAMALRPWEHGGAVALRQVVTLSLSVDHRVLDGEEGARFLADVGATLADPARAFVG